jgi:hypothetical protein
VSTRRGSGYTWATWITPVLSGDAQCVFAPWFQSHYTFEKVTRDDFKLAQWKVDHTNMVRARTVRLLQEGWTVYLESQNKFTLQGTRLTLAGKPDLVAVRGADARVIDCKTGKRRDSDGWQVCVYLYALPHAHPAITKGHQLTGEVQYRDGSVFLPALEPSSRAHLLQLLTRLGDPTPPGKVPSASECRCCPLPADECPERVEEPDRIVAVGEF